MLARRGLWMCRCYRVTSREVAGAASMLIYCVGFFCLQVFPAKYGKELISTPQFLINFFEAGQYTHSYTPAGNQVRAPRPQGACVQL